MILKAMVNINAIFNNGEASMSSEQECGLSNICTKTINLVALLRKKLQ